MIKSTTYILLCIRYKILEPFMVWWMNVWGFLILKAFAPNMTRPFTVAIKIFIRTYMNVCMPDPTYVRCAPTFCWTMIGKPRLYLRNSIHGFFKKKFISLIVCKKNTLSWNNSFSNAIFVKEYSFSKYILISFISWLEKYRKKPF